MSNSEYTRPTVSGSSCAYANLGHYNMSWPGKHSPAISPGTVSGKYVVPAYGAPGYGTLTSSKPSCSGYFGINNAYGHFGTSCGTKFMTSMCGQGH
jgi:hypothetical protein